MSADRSPDRLYLEQCVKVAGDTLALWHGQREKAIEYRNKYWRVQDERNNLLDAAKAAVAGDAGALGHLAEAIEQAEGRA